MCPALYPPLSPRPASEVHLINILLRVLPSPASVSPEWNRLFPTVGGGEWVCVRGIVVDVGGPHWVLRVCCLHFPPHLIQPRVQDTCVLCFLGPTPARPAPSVRSPGTTHVDHPDFSLVFGTWCLSSTQMQSYGFFPHFSLSLGPSPCLCDQLVLSTQSDNKRWNNCLYSTQ